MAEGAAKEAITHTFPSGDGGAATATAQDAFKEKQRCKTFEVAEWQ
jgi:hypothetical protein